MDTLQKLMAKKKKDKPLSDVAKDAKISVVKNLQSMASDAMKEGLKGGLKKSSPEDKSAGELTLDNVHEALPISPPEGKENLEPSEEDEGEEECSEEELDAKLEALMAKKKKLQDKKSE